MLIWSMFTHAQASEKCSRYHIRGNISKCSDNEIEKGVNSALIFEELFYLMRIFVKYFVCVLRSRNLFRFTPSKCLSYVVRLPQTAHAF